jgi:hypothetical protein
MGDRKKTTKCKFCIVSFAGIGVISRIVNKVLTGHGLDYYATKNN